MKINKFKCVAVLGLAVFLSSCGGGGGSSSVPADGNGGVNPPVTNEDGDNVNKVLPFNLNKPDGTIAVAFGFGAASASFPMSQDIQILASMSVAVPYEGEQGNSSNPILISSFIEPECSSGSMVFSENTPPTPVRLNDSHPWPALSIVEVNAQKCRFKNKRGFIDGLKFNRLEYTGGDETATIVYSSELTNFTSDPYGEEGLTDEAILAKNYSATGSWYHSSVASNDSDDVEGEISVPHFGYVHASGLNLVVSDFSQKTSRVSGVTTFQSHSYNVEWNIPEGSGGDHITDDFTGLLGFTSKKDFPAGEYNLSVLVTSPLVYKPTGNGFLVASAGSVTVNLLSHNMKADIVYHQGYADVTYSSLEGGIKQVRLNGDGSTEIISP